MYLMLQSIFYVRVSLLFDAGVQEKCWTTCACCTCTTITRFVKKDVSSQWDRLLRWLFTQADIGNHKPFILKMYDLDNHTPVVLQPEHTLKLVTDQRSLLVYIDERLSHIVHDLQAKKAYMYQWQTYRVCHVSGWRRVRQGASGCVRSCRRVPGCVTARQGVSVWVRMCVRMCQDVSCHTVLPDMSGYVSGYVPYSCNNVSGYASATQSVQVQCRCTLNFYSLQMTELQEVCCALQRDNTRLLFEKQHMQKRIEYLKISINSRFRGLNQ